MPRAVTVRLLAVGVSGLQLARSVLPLLASVVMVLALRYIPLADATALTFVAPIFMTVLAGPLLGERAGARRWAGGDLSFAGVIIVVRPVSGTPSSPSARSR